MIFTADDYSAETGRSATLDLGDAIAAAVARRVKRAGINLSKSGALTPFAEVFTDWATWNNRYVFPTACVVSDAEVRYDDSSLTPSLLEETWARHGEPGMGLWKEAEGVVDLKVFLRAPSKRERAKVILAVEELFTRPGSVLRGGAYRIIEPMEEYWGLGVRLSAQGVTRFDGTDSAANNRWEAVVRVSAQAPKVKLDVVNPMSIKVRTFVDGAPDTR